ncbi:MAG: hypothetical protein LBR38_07660 [Synergistaceae bacterium]|jgi:hypothetical protein|nr:hypothetical protein [Synergistaceae bacterium]
MDCVWYVSGFDRPWEAAVVGALAGALSEGSAAFHPEVYVEGGTAFFPSGGLVRSWQSMTIAERARLVTFKGRLWHLWGEAPSWWPLVRLRAQTVHTSLDADPDWSGQPTRLQSWHARHGENVIPPVFDARAVWDEPAHEREAFPTLILAAKPDRALREAISKSELVAVPLSAARTRDALAKASLLFVDDAATNALLAAYMAVRGVPVVAQPRAEVALNATLGEGGFLVPRGDWKETLDNAQGPPGRMAAAAARRHLADTHGTERSVRALESLYRSVLYADGKGNKKK